MLGWPHQLNAQELEQTLGDGEGQGSLVRCGPMGSQRNRHTESLNTECQDTSIQRTLLVPLFFLTQHHTFCLAKHFSL